MARELNAEQRRALAVIEKGHNVAILGQAGTGKTFLVAEAAKRLRLLGKKVAVTATTGIAATQFQHGETLHRWSGILDGRFTNDEAVQRVRTQPETLEAIRTTDVLIVDEVSMLSARTFEQVEHVCRKVRACNDFCGGVQVIGVGDFLQLRPVPNLMYGDPGMYIFLSPIFQSGIPHKIVLETVLRQEERELATVVNELERGTPSKETNIYLKSLARPIRPLPMEEKQIHLFGTNFEVDYFNAESLAAEKGMQQTYVSEDTGEQDQLKKLKVKKKITLKCLCPVVLLQNLSSSLVNGLQGKVIKLEEDGPIVQFPNVAVKVQKTAFSLYDPVSGQVLAERRQIPIALGYALTVHKAQGLTLNNVVVNCSNIHQPGQLGVAVGRAKSSKGLQVLNYRPQLCCQHPEEVIQYVDGTGTIFLDDLSCCRKSQLPADVAAPSTTQHSTGGLVLEDSEISEDELDSDVISVLQTEEVEGQVNQEGTSADVTLPIQGTGEQPTTTEDSLDWLQLLNKIRVLEPQTREQSSINCFVQTLASHPSAAVYIQYLFNEMCAAYTPDHGKFLQWFHQFVSSASPKERLSDLLINVLKEEDRSADFQIFYGLLLTTVRKEVVSCYECSRSGSTAEETVTTKELPTSAHGKVRYVGGSCVAKLKSRHIKSIRAAMEKGALQQTHKSKRQKIQVLEALTTTQASLLQVSKYPESIEETAKRQNLVCGLTNISDPAFEFFLKFEEKRIRLYQKHAVQGQDVLHMVQDQILSDCSLLLLFRTAVALGVPEGADFQSEVVQEVFQELSCAYLRITDNEFRKQLLEKLGREKLMEHRKRVLQRQSKQQKPKFSVQTITEEGKDVSRDKVKAAVKSGHISLLTKAELLTVSSQLFNKKLSVKLTKEKLIAEVSKCALGDASVSGLASLRDVSASGPAPSRDVSASGPASSTTNPLPTSTSEPCVKGTSALPGKGKGRKRRHNP